MASFSAAVCLSLSPKATFSDILAGPGVWDSTCLCLPILGPQAQAAVLAFNTGAENSHCGPHAHVASTLSSWVISLAHQLCPHKGVTSSLLLWKREDRHDTGKRDSEEGPQPRCTWMCYPPGTNSNSNLRKLTATQHSWAGHGTFCFLHMCERTQQRSEWESVKCQNNCTLI